MYIDPEIEEERLVELTKLAAMWGDNELNERYGYDSFGAHELLDRTYVAMTTWVEYIRNHPRSLMHPSLFAKACEIETLMAEFYTASIQDSPEIQNVAR